MSDTDNIVRWRNNPNVVKNFIFREPFTAEIHTKWMENKVKTGQVVQYIIEDLESGKDVGSSVSETLIRPITVQNTVSS